MISFNGRHGLVVSYSTATATNLKLEALFPSNLDARQGQVVYDTKRNQLYFIAQLPNRAINKKGETVPTLAYTLAVMKRNATGSLLGTSSVNMMGGETNLLHSSISAFYDDVRDRLVACLLYRSGVKLSSPTMWFLNSLQKYRFVLYNEKIKRKWPSSSRWDSLRSIQRKKSDNIFKIFRSSVAAFVAIGTLEYWLF